MGTEQKLIRSKMGLLELAGYLQNVSKACHVMGYSRDTFYRVKNAYDEGGVEALYEQNRRVPNLKNRVSSEVEEAIVAMVYEDPSLGQKRVSSELTRRGLFISPAGVRCVWLRHNLETFRKRLKALEDHVSKTGEVVCQWAFKSLPIVGVKNLPLFGFGSLIYSSFP